MIYSITITNATEKVLYMPGDKDYAVTGAVLYSALNDAGYLEFMVPPSNPLYGEIYERKTKVTLYGDNAPIWYGFVLESTDNMQMEHKVYCVGELSYLKDTIQPQAKYQHKTPLQLFTTYLAQHNAQSSEQFEVGVVTVTDPNDDVYRFTNQESTLTALREDLCKSLEGYLRIRRENGHRYLDLVKLEDYGHDNEQVIEFGYNLLDYSKNVTAADIATACLPRGARLETSPIEGLDAYVDIKSVNDGVDFVQDDTAVAEFGMIKKVVTWDNVTTPTELKAKAIQWLATNQFATMKLSLKAVDMNLFNKDIESFEVGDMVNAKAQPYGMDAWFPVQEKTVHLQDPTQTVIELANSKQLSYTQQQSNISAGIQKDIPQMSSFLDLAKLNAQHIIDLATEGNVYLVKDADGRPVELRIMDAPTEEQATKMWKWNLNGWYSSIRNTTSDQWTTTLAAVLGGGIVADMITTGTLNLGGSNDETILKIYNAQNQLIGQWNKDGIEISQGSIHDANNKMIIDVSSGTIVATDTGGAANGRFYALRSDDSGFSNMGSDGFFTYRGSNYTWVFPNQVTAHYGSNNVEINANGLGTGSAGLTVDMATGGYCIKTYGKNNIAYSGAWQTSSARKYKKNIKKYEGNALEKINEIEVVSFNYKTDENNEIRIGFIADDTDAIFATENHDTMDLNNCIGMLLKSVQELAAKVDELSDN